MENPDGETSELACSALADLVCDGDAAGGIRLNLTNVLTLMKHLHGSYPEAFWHVIGFYERCHLCGGLIVRDNPEQHECDTDD